VSNYRFTDQDTRQIRYRLGLDGEQEKPQFDGGAQLVDVDGLTYQEAMRCEFAAVAGKCSGVGTTTETYYGADGVTPRVIVQLDSVYNRVDVEYNK
jgi:hypothetical protein